MNYLVENWERTGRLVLEHLGISLVATAGAGLVGVLLGVWVSRPAFRSYGPGLLSLSGGLTAVPAIAMVALAYLVLGVGARPAVVALIIYSLVPVFYNATAGLLSVPAAPVAAARGIGFRPGQVLRRVELPLAAPAIVAGLRNAMTLNVGTATIASFIGGGGLGDLIFTGLKLYRLDMVLIGSLLAALLALLLDALLALAARLVALHRGPS